MKKAALTALLLIIPFLLFASFYKSNQISQALEEIENLTKEGYCLEVNENEKKLYLDGNLIETNTKIVEDNCIYEKKITDYSIYTRVFCDSRLLRESYESENESYSIIYSYLDGLLVLCTYIDEIKESTTAFLRDRSGRFVAIQRNDSLSMDMGSVFFNEGRSFVIVSKNTVVEGTATFDGKTTIIENQEDRYIYEDGLLVRSENSKSYSLYFYEDYILLRKQTYFENKMTEEHYKGTVLTQSLEYENDNLVSKTIFSKDGNVQELYDKGVLIAIVHYASDNRSIESIEYK